MLTRTTGAALLILLLAGCAQGGGSGDDCRLVRVERGDQSSTQLRCGTASGPTVEQNRVRVRF